MSNFITRTITGISMVIVLLAAIYSGGLFFSVVFLVITILGLWEFYNLIPEDTASPQKIFGTLAGALIFMVTAWFINIGSGVPGNQPSVVFTLISFIPLAFTSFLIEIYRRKAKPMANTGMTILGLVYIAMPFSLLLQFTDGSAVRFLGMPVLLAGYFGFTWIYDTVAYLFGKQFGRHKLFERISPKKTWEGTLSGAAFTLIAAFAFFKITGVLLLIDWLALALMVIVFGTLGDLAESMFKRSLNIKDSGNILPGHGGILDRFDTVLISAPFVFLYFFIRNVI